MPVYLIQAGDSGPVKIGHARNPAKRMAGFQCGNHEVLRLVRTWPGGQREEATLHRAFSDYRLQGEWFRFCPAMLDADPKALLAAMSVVERCAVVDTPLQAIIRKAGGPSRVARELGRHHTSVLGWTKVPAEHARAVAKLAAVHPCVVRPDLYDPPAGLPVQASASQSAAA